MSLSHLSKFPRRCFLPISLALGCWHTVMSRCLIPAAAVVKKGCGRSVSVCAIATRGEGGWLVATLAGTPTSSVARQIASSHHCPALNRSCVLPITPSPPRLQMHQCNFFPCFFSWLLLERNGRFERTRSVSVSTKKKKTCRTGWRLNAQNIKCYACTELLT